MTRKSETLKIAQNTALSDLGEKGKEIDEFLPLFFNLTSFICIKKKKKKGRLIWFAQQKKPKKPKPVLLRGFHPQFDKIILKLFQKSAYVKWVLFWLPPLGFSISCLSHPDVSATTRAPTFTWFQPSLCCRAPVPAPWTGDSQAPPAIPGSCLSADSMLL